MNERFSDIQKEVVTIEVPDAHISPRLVEPSEVGSGVTTPNLNVVASMRVAKAYARDARMQLGLREHTVSNETVSREWMLRHMFANNMRRKDISVILPLACKLVFILSDGEKIAEQLAITEEYQTEYQLARTGYWTRGPPTWLNWLGNVRTSPKPAPS